MQGVNTREREEEKMVPKGKGKGGPKYRIKCQMFQKEGEFGIPMS